MHTTRFCVGVVLAAAGGCAVGPNYHTRATSAPATWSGLRSGPAATQPSAPTTQPADVATWWKTLRDPTLDQLMATAAQANLDLRLATARVREARATRDVTAAPLWPQINLDGSYSYRGSSENAGSAMKTSKSRVAGLPTITVQPGAGGVGSPNITVSPARAGPMQLGGSRAPSLTLVPGTFSTANGAGVPTAILSPPGAGSLGALRGLTCSRSALAAWTLPTLLWRQRAVVLPVVNTGQRVLALVVRHAHTHRSRTRPTEAVVRQEHDTVHAAVAGP
jgi:hypothetical protein